VRGQRGCNAAQELGIRVRRRLQAPRTLRCGRCALKFYSAPDAATIDDAVVLIRAGRIVRVVGRDDPAAKRVSALAPGCDGGVVVAGFQNSHVHFIGPAFERARTAPAEMLSNALTQLLTQHGFTTAFDIGSDRDNTLALRQRVERGELNGPRILTAGLPLFPPNGLPIYMGHLSPSLLAKMPQPDTVASALETVRQNLDAGVDATKLFLVTPQGPRGIRRMPDEIAAAAVAESHKRGKLAFAHPTDLDGVRAALQAKVDILAHPPLGVPGPWPAALMDQLRADGVHMIPTLKLLKYELAKEQVPAQAAERIVRDNVRDFGRFAAAGGKVLFGTDVDYMTDTDPSEEYELMALAGLAPMQILASLTTTPAERWNEAQRRGRLAPGMDADIVVLNDDPARSVRHFANVKCTIRGGKVVYAR
jgi:imidazolonepropionase-like amidohydrolase